MNTDKEGVSFPGLSIRYKSWKRSRKENTENYEGRVWRCEYFNFTQEEALLNLSLKNKNKYKINY
ncbi:hypothetical protein QNN00_17835 [Bacillus velezensis]|nr:hypothetical protein [Bacillus velezensis]